MSTKIDSLDLKEKKLLEDLTIMIILCVLVRVDFLSLTPHQLLTFIYVLKLLLNLVLHKSA